jgi:hypothetical protein
VGVFFLLFFYRVAEMIETHGAAITRKAIAETLKHYETKTPLTWQRGGVFSFLGLNLQAGKRNHQGN